MDFVTRYAKNYSQQCRANRAEVFRQLFAVTPDTKLLDLGSEVGEHVAKLVAGTEIDPANVYIADIHAEAVNEGARRFGFTPVVIGESGRLPFPDNYFDIVHCSSVIEHVTLPKSEIWSVRSGSEFRDRAEEAQAAFAREIMRVGRQFYVQTPNKWYPVESHTWLPLVGYLPRRLLLPLLKVTNKYWVKGAGPDYHLLGARKLSQFFGGRPVIKEKSFGLVKSVTVYKVDPAD
jgi:SAM-dependent methyltransferase